MTWTGPIRNPYQKARDDVGVGNRFLYGTPHSPPAGANVIGAGGASRPPGVRLPLSSRPAGVRRSMSPSSSWLPTAVWYGIRPAIGEIWYMNASQIDWYPGGGGREPR